MVIYLSEEPDHPGFEAAQHKIGDKVRVIKITLTETDEGDTRNAFLSALGKTFKIEEVNLWESGDTAKPWHVTYEIEVGELDTIFLNDDELILVESAVVEPVRPKINYPASHPMGSGELY